MMCLLTTVAATNIAHADPRDPRAADALFREARELIKAGDCENAIPKLRASQRLDPAAGTLLSLAQCEEKMNKPGSAWLHYKQAVELLPADDTRRPYAVARRNATTVDAPKITVQPSGDVPDDATILWDEIELDARSLDVPLPVDAGDHAVVVSCPGHKDGRFAILIGHGGSKIIRVACGEPDATTTVSVTDQGGHPPTSDGAVKQQPDASDSTATLGYVLGGAGLVALGAGAYFSVHASQLNEQATNSTENYNDLGFCNTYCSERTDLSRKNSTYAYASFGTGGALVVTGLLMVLLTPSSETSDASKLSVNIMAEPTAATVKIGGAW